jgi:antitoxin HigA-1
MSGNPLLRGLAPAHPGEILRAEILPATGLTKIDVARRLGVSRQSLYDLVDDRRPVTPQMALRLARLFGNSAAFWLDLQRDHDLRTLQSALAPELDRIEPLAS